MVLPFGVELKHSYCLRSARSPGRGYSPDEVFPRRSLELFLAMDRDVSGYDNAALIILLDGLCKRTRQVLDARRVTFKQGATHGHWIGIREREHCRDSISIQEASQFCRTPLQKGGEEFSADLRALALNLVVEVRPDRSLTLIGNDA